MNDEAKGKLIEMHKLAAEALQRDHLNIYWVIIGNMKEAHKDERGF